MANDSLVVTIPVLKKEHEYLRDAVIAGDTLYYAYGDQIFCLPLPRPWQPAQPQLLLTTDGRID